MRFKMDDDLLEMLGVTLPITSKVAVKGMVLPISAKVPPRFTEWNNSKSFEFGGYLAKTVRHTCKMCEGYTEMLLGIFIEEIHRASGTRKLTQMAKGGQFPFTAGEHRLEITDEEVECCSACIRQLGFSREVDAKGLPYTITVKG